MATAAARAFPRSVLVFHGERIMAESQTRREDVPTTLFYYYYTTTTTTRTTRTHWAIEQVDGLQTHSTGGPPPTAASWFVCVSPRFWWHWVAASQLAQFCHLHFVLFITFVLDSNGKNLPLHLKEGEPKTRIWSISTQLSVWLSVFL